MIVAADTSCRCHLPTATARRMLLDDLGWEASMKVRLHATFAILVLAALPMTAYQNCTITFENRTSNQLSMNVDDHYGCTANAGSVCTSTENGSCHTLHAMSGQQELISRTVADCSATTYTWCVSDNNSCGDSQ